MTPEDIFMTFFYNHAYSVNSPEDIENIEDLINSNFKFRTALMQEDLYIESALIDILSEEAVHDTFDEQIIRKAFEKGIYPMSMKRRITKFEDAPELIQILNNEPEKLNDITIPYFKNFLTLKHHKTKLIITFDKLHITKKLRPWLKEKFADYTMTFNKDFNQCIDKLVEAYPDTWLCPELVESYKKIHANPDGIISLDSVEIWHNGELVAGEIGFITKNSYASLSGFHTEDDIGTVQMCMLGLYLKQNGFAYWDLGMELDYKYRYGAVEYNRKQQKEIYDSLEDKKLEFTDKEILFKNFDY